MSFPYRSFQLDWPWDWTRELWNRQLVSLQMRLLHPSFLDTWTLVFRLSLSPIASNTHISVSLSWDNVSGALKAWSGFLIESWKSIFLSVLVFTCYFGHNFFSVSFYCYFLWSHDEHSIYNRYTEFFTQALIKKRVIPGRWIPARNTWLYLKNAFGCHLKKFCLLLQSERFGFCLMFYNALDRIFYKIPSSQI